MLVRLRAELRPVPHAAHALAWISGPKAVASSSSMERIRLSLEVTDLLRFFEPRLFSASFVTSGKPAPDLFQLAARDLKVRSGGLHRGRGFAPRASLPPAPRA